MRLPERDTPVPSTESFYGGLPIGWNERRLRFLSQIIPSNVDKHSRDDEVPVELCNYTDVYYNDRITLGLQFMEATATSEQIARFGLQAGDTIITKDSETADDIGIPAFVPNALPGVVCGYHLTILRPGSDVEGKFIHWLFQAAPMRSRLETLATGLTRVGLSQQALKDLVIPLPSLEEQRRIAAFLDHETARIDELVHEQERLRTQLLEKRSAVISASATTGLDDEALTRDSGVAWLGEVSSEWSLVRLLHVSRIRSGLVDPTDERFVDFTLIAPNHVESETGRLLELSTAREQGAISGKYRCYHGDVIYSKIRPALAKACLSPGDEVLCSADMYAIAPGERLLSEFLLLFLLSDAFTRFAVLESDRVAMPKINQESLKDCWIPLPPIHEQQVIVERAFAALKDVDALLDESNRLIDLLLERRAALISAAVTGQLDLRDWQSPELEAVAEVA